VLLQQLLGLLIMENYDLMRRNVHDSAVKLGSGPQLEESVKAKADLDGDGIVTETELREVYGAKKDPNIAQLQKFIQQADLDGDGVVSEDELMKFARLASAAKVGDVDDHGTISKEELKDRYGDAETARKFMTITEGTEDLDAVLSETELQRLVTRVEARKASMKHPAASETDSFKVRRTLSAYDKEQRAMVHLLEADKHHQQAELEKQLTKRRRRKAALKRMANHDATHQIIAGATNLEQIEELLAKLTAEAMEDGVIDEDEQLDIDDAKAALER
jgi:hypothetical protein